MSDGNIRRWREGKRHNAHLKVNTIFFFGIVPILCSYLGLNHFFFALVYVARFPYVPFSGT